MYLPYGVSFSCEQPEFNRITSIEKIYHYDESQLAGVVFGCGMREQDRDEVLKILEAKRQSVRVFQAIALGNEVDITPFKSYWYNDNES